ELDPDVVLDRIDDLYGDMPRNGAATDRGPGEPERTGFRFRTMTGDIAHAHLELGWRTPGTVHDDTPALDLLAAIMGQGRGSRLYREVREEG
ncbi:MAG: hypothetical protein GWM90_10135, partial [Gemmatimonadetes bacterium]|nr:insulinase family protein [Gemmatimonadota bacterium]NIQ54299.1 insulinase family protein [Gemmatimonadota bacterium]NIU74509.1 hypothetical protein [Gammaproteobacteria bacterium]NIX44462.1 hypothetical protein [Gemmatimonadota bacterium]